MRRLIAVSLTIVALAACDDTIAPSSPSADGPSFAIQDGAHNGGNPHFYWLPPLVPSPATTGVFNGELAVNLEICQLLANPSIDPATTCNANVTPISFGPDQIGVSLTDELYHVNWDTDGVNPSGFYRLSAYVGTDPATRFALGFIDFDPVDKGMKNVRTGEVVAFQEGRMIPLKFRVEQGVLCPTGECIERTVTKGEPGETELVQYTETVDGIALAPLAGVAVPTEAFPPGVTSLTFKIEKKRTGGGGGILQQIAATQEAPVLCHPTLPLEQFDGCFEITTVPELPPLDESGRQFAADITVAVCFELHETNDPREDFVQLYASDPGEPARALPSATHLGLMPIHEALDCGESFASNERGNALMRFASRSARTFARGLGYILGVQTAYAVDRGLGGLTQQLSNIGPALTAQMEQVSDDEVTVDAGESTIATVRLLGTTEHTSDPSFDEGIPATNVTFAVAAGHGILIELGTEGEVEGTTLTIPTSVSDGESPAGFASIEWLPPSTPGTYTMTATAAAFGSPLTFTAIVPEPPPPAGIELGPTERRMLSMQTGASIQIGVTGPTQVATWFSSNFENATVSATGVVTAVVGGENINAAADASISTVLANGSPGPSMLVNSFVFDLFPRVTTLVWRPVEGAATYEVQTEFGFSCTVPATCGTWSNWSPGTTTTSALHHTFEFVGAQPGRWRVIARNAAGQIISTSALVYFAYEI